MASDGGAECDVEIGQDDGDDDDTPLDYDIIVSPVDYPLESLHRKISSKEVMIPPFQREYVWDRVRASRLIESFLMGLPVPPVFLLEQKDRNMLVIDGLQRLLTLHYFFKEEFGVAENGSAPSRFKLVGINNKGRLNGKAFSELDPGDRRLLENTVLRALIIRQMHPEKNPAVVHHIFERLNTGGMHLRDQEVRNCIYSGRLNDLLDELNRAPIWRRFLGRPALHRRKKDVELVLRYMALFHGVGGYRKPMKDFLSRFMYENRDPSDAFLYREKARFHDTCQTLVDRMGDGPLTHRGLVNPSAFDAIFTSTARRLDALPHDLGDRVRRLRSNPAFAECTSKATTDPASIRRRHDLAMKEISG